MKVVHKEETRVPYRSTTPCNRSYPCRTILYEKGYSIAQCGKEGIPSHMVEHRLPFGHDVVEGICKQLEWMTLTQRRLEQVTWSTGGGKSLWSMPYKTRFAINGPFLLH